MSTVEDLIRDVEAAGITLRVDGHGLVFTPADRLTPELKARLKEHKSELLSRFSRRVEPEPDRYALRLKPGIEEPENVLAILRSAEAAGCELLVRGSDLILRAPDIHSIPEELKAKLREHKAALIDKLQTIALMTPGGGNRDPEWGHDLELRFHCTIQWVSDYRSNKQRRVPSAPTDPAVDPGFRKFYGYLRERERIELLKGTDAPLPVDPIFHCYEFQSVRRPWNETLSWPFPAGVLRGLKLIYGRPVTQDDSLRLIAELYQARHRYWPSGHIPLKASDWAGLFAAPARYWPKEYIPLKPIDIACGLQQFARYESIRRRLRARSRRSAGQRRSFKVNDNLEQD